MNSALAPKKNLAYLTHHPMPELAVKTLADTIFKKLLEEGCRAKDMISVSSQLISLVTSELQKEVTPPMKAPTLVP